MVLSDFTLFGNGPKMQDAHLGVVASMTLGAASIVADIGGTFVIPKDVKIGPLPVFGPGSTFNLGLYARCGLRVTGSNAMEAITMGRGKWVEPFGVKIFHIEDVQGTVGLSYTGLIDNLQLGGTLWIGHADEESGELDEENTVKLATYIGAAADVGTPLWFYGSLNELSVSQVL